MKYYIYIIIIFFIIFNNPYLYSENLENKDYIDNYIKNDNNISNNLKNEYNDQSLIINNATINDYKNILSNITNDLARSFMCNSLTNIINNSSNNIYSENEKIKIIIDCATYIDSPNEKVITALSEIMFKIKSQQ